MVVKLNASKADADMELEQTKKKLAAMEKLNRTLTAERSQLLKGKKEATENGSWKKKKIVQFYSLSLEIHVVKKFCLE